ncbi:DUF2283 domain-containing protein [Corynebacterium pseudodiphtheriticum]|uniref:DUF2283 domain-containing protein n=1 Tax=Corynebacterium pseudodiphtheriticum TaxID=37637 RepID=UPI0009DECB24|nr:DUF2283 domain-containing protein [Corynebacterium pseudodiphtheriticum]
MNFDYDPEADAAYLAIVQPGALSERQISGITTEKMEGEIEIDIDENGKVIGIEFVNASLILPSDFLKKQTGYHRHHRHREFIPPKEPAQTTVKPNSNCPKQLK